jgi:hypothetical protein
VRVGEDYMWFTGKDFPVHWFVFKIIVYVTVHVLGSQKLYMYIVWYSCTLSVHELTVLDSLDPVSRLVERASADSCNSCDSLFGSGNGHDGCGLYQKVVVHILYLMAESMFVYIFSNDCTSYVLDEE